MFAKQRYFQYARQYISYARYPTGYPLSAPPVSCIAKSDFWIGIGLSKQRYKKSRYHSKEIQIALYTAIDTDPWFPNSRSGGWSFWFMRGSAQVPFSHAKS